MNEINERNATNKPEVQQAFANVSLLT